MIREFVLTHPEAPASVNAGGGGSRRHWAVGHREKKRWEGILLALLLKHKVPQGMTHCHATATIRWKSRSRRRDSTNYIAPVVKPLADVLAPSQFRYVKIGEQRIAQQNHAPRWLPDDTDEFFRFGGLAFEFPDVWPHRDPRVKAELVVRLEATYSQPRQVAQGDSDA